MRGTLTAISFIALVVLGYTASCACWPMARCAWPGCDGGRLYRGNQRRIFRDCRWCRGTGRRLRIGRRVWNAYRRRRAAAR